MDAEYLQETVGISLAKGLAEVSSVRPADPIEYLALWLLKHKDNIQKRQYNPEPKLRTSVYAPPPVQYTVVKAESAVGSQPAVSAPLDSLSERSADDVDSGEDPSRERFFSEPSSITANYPSRERFYSQPEQTATRGIQHKQSAPSGFGNELKPADARERYYSEPSAASAEEVTRERFMSQPAKSPSDHVISESEGEPGTEAHEAPGDTEVPPTDTGGTPEVESPRISEPVTTSQDAETSREPLTSKSSTDQPSKVEKLEPVLEEGEREEEEGEGETTVDGTKGGEDEAAGDTGDQPST